MKILCAALVLAFCVPASGHAATSRVPVASGALLSTNLSAAVLRLDNFVGVGTNGIYGNAAPAGITAFDFCPGGNCGADPISGPAPAGCVPSPENGTALLALLGFAGLLVGRFSYGRMQRSRVAASA